MIKRFKGAWRVDLSFMQGNQRVRVRKNVATQLEAAKWEEWALGRIAKGLPLEEAAAPKESSGWTLSTLLDAVHSRYWKGTSNEENALRNAEECVVLLGEGKHPNEIRGEDVDAMVRELVTKGNSPATINRKLSALGKMFSHALSRGIIDRKPSMDRAKEPKGRLRWYSADEEAAFLNYLAKHNPELGELVLFLADTGCRLSEALGLEGRDVDAYARFHETKNGTGRAVPLTTRVKAMLARRRGRLLIRDTDPVFGGWTVHTASREWNEAREALGFKDDPQAVLHTWRHTCASRLVQASVPIQVVQQWLGHKSIQVTLRYAHLAPINMLSAAATLDTLVSREADRIRCTDAGHTTDPRRAGIDVALSAA